MQTKPRIFQSLIQSSWEPHRNFHAVVVEGESLVHWERDNSGNNGDPDWFPWHRKKTIVSSGVRWPGSIIQSNFNEGNLEVVVPLIRGERVELWHFFRLRTDPTGEWREGGRVTKPDDDVGGAPALIQSNLGEHDNFEVVVPIKKGDHLELWHYFRDHSVATRPWIPGKRVTREGDDVQWGGSMIQGPMPIGEHKNLEVVVPLRADNGAFDLHHFFHDSSNVTLDWQYGGLVSRNVTGPGILIQSDFGDLERHNFEVIVPEGSVLRHYWRDNSDDSHPWRPAKIITESLNGWATIIQSNFGGGTHKNFEVLAEEAGASLVSYVRTNEFESAPWFRHLILIGRNHGTFLSTRKIVQLTGDEDISEVLPFGVISRDTINQTGIRFGIHGTDLGSSFQHNNKTYFLFGDTWPSFFLGEPLGDDDGFFQNRDAVAFTEDTHVDPVEGLRLTFLQHPPMLHPLPEDHDQLIARQGEYNVPLEGVSLNNRMFVFFTQGHTFIEPGHHYVHESVVTQCMDSVGSPNEGVNFHRIYQFSNNKFINISLERGLLTTEEASQLNLVDPEVLFIWGTGRYRASDVYLCIKSTFHLSVRDGIRYYCGKNGSFQWSLNEEDATPLVNTGSVGELSVRWNKFLQRYFMMFNADSPKGIMLHSAKKPWGPWTQTPRTVFSAEHSERPEDCIKDGLRRFIHAGWNRRDLCFQDHMHEGRPNPPWSLEESRDLDGDAYGPYQIGHMATGLDGEFTDLFFTMSTWNPYQVVLMTTRVTTDDLEDDADLIKKMMAKSSALFTAGQHPEAIAMAQRAVGMARGVEPIPSRRTEFLTLLGDALNNLTLRYKETGHLPEAGLTASETAQAFLFAANAPHANRLYIADQLINLAGWLVGPPIPMPAEAVNPAQVAVEVLRGIAAPTGLEFAYADKFALCLGTLVSRLIGASRRDEAVLTAPAAIDAYRRAANFPTADHIPISENLQSISTWLAHLTPPATIEAIAPQQASVDVLRIAPTDELRYRSSLAQRLHGLASRLRDAQRTTEALVTAREALGLYDRLVAEDEAFTTQRNWVRQLIESLGG
jgi:hypothetical protein